MPDHPERVRDCSDKANYAYQSTYRPDIFYLIVSFGFAKFTKWARNNSPKAIEILERAIRTAENRIARSLRSPPAPFAGRRREVWVHCCGAAVTLGQLANTHGPLKGEKAYRVKRPQRVTMLQNGRKAHVVFFAFGGKQPEVQL